MLCKHICNGWSWVLDIMRIVPVWCHRICYIKKNINSVIFQKWICTFSLTCRIVNCKKLEVFFLKIRFQKSHQLFWKVLMSFLSTCSINMNDACCLSCEIICLSRGTWGAASVWNGHLDTHYPECLSVFYRTNFSEDVIV